MPPGFFKNLFIVQPSVRIAELHNVYRRFLQYVQRLKDLSREGANQAELDRIGLQYVTSLARGYMNLYRDLIDMDEVKFVPPIMNLDDKALSIIRMMQELRKGGYLSRIDSVYHQAVELLLEKRPVLREQLQLAARNSAYFKAADELLLKPLSKLTGFKGPYVHARQALYNSLHYKRPRKREGDSDTEDDAMRE